MPLRPVSVEEPFAQWGLVFIRMINPPSSTGQKWILTATDYFTRWSEVVPLRNSSKSKVLDFLEDLTCWYYPPKTVISDNVHAFTGSRITQFTLSRGIYLKTSSSYYPQGNGLVESTNKNLIQVIKRIGFEYKEWHHHLRNALWADRIMPKQILKNSPYKLVYGKDALFPLSLEILTLQLLKSMEVAENVPMVVRLAEIMELEEAREVAFTTLQNRQEVLKRWFDSKKSSNLIFALEDLVLKYNERTVKPGQHNKFDCLWEGPFAS
ncbi:uncharacterized protein LOC131857560 [Cryptomeria japonica]|uniref:uncharacterized protein LOC131857560 n=1 Tax=Cryptomeria japonica TaxID=3369 RepID=UPI0027DA49A8|nr:uncharacterized protein LOC131857560 [Cryptomeria japonica]